MSSCHNCKQIGHKAAACPLPSNLTCFNCKQSGHKSNACPTGKREQEKFVPKRRNDEEVVTTPLVLDGMWGKNSAKLKSDCALSQLKRLFLTAVPRVQIDAQNEQPHININGDAAMYAALNGKSLTLCFRDLHFRHKTIEIEVARGVHYTLVYRNEGIKSDLTALLPILSSVWSGWCADLIANAPGAAAPINNRESAKALELGECPIGLELMIEPLSIHPCGHTFCANNLRPIIAQGRKTCPLCNGQIQSTAINFALHDVLNALKAKVE